MGPPGARPVVLDAGALVAFERKDRRVRRLVGCGVLDVAELDLGEAQAPGVLCGLASTADVVDASVEVLARRYGANVMTSDPNDMRRLDPKMPVVAC